MYLYRIDERHVKIVMYKDKTIKQGCKEALLNAIRLQIFHFHQFISNMTKMNITYFVEEIFNFYHVTHVL